MARRRGRINSSGRSLVSFMHVVPIKHEYEGRDDVKLPRRHHTSVTSPRYIMYYTYIVRTIVCKRRAKTWGKVHLAFIFNNIGCLKSTMFELSARINNSPPASAYCSFVCLLHFILSHFLTQILSHLKVAGTFAISQTLRLGSPSSLCSILLFRSTTKSVKASKVHRIVGTHGPKVTVVPTSLRFALLQIKRYTFLAKRTIV